MPIVVILLVRIIPASAGSTGETGPQGPAGADHPRIRGEHYGWKFRRSKGFGSSPHPRGALPHLGDQYLIERIIPASAGSTYRFHAAISP